MKEIDTIREALTYYHEHSLSMDEHITANALAALSTIEAEHSDPCKGCIPPSRDFCLTLPKCPEPDTAHDDAIRRECADRAEEYIESRSCINIRSDEIRAAIIGKEAEK